MNSIATNHLINDDGSIKTKVYRKETHTDQYLHLNSNHPLEHKTGVVKTLVHRVDTIVSNERDKIEEKSHVKKACHMNGYPDWLINSIPSTQPSLESMNSVLSNDTQSGDDGQDTVKDNNQEIHQ